MPAHPGKSVVLKPTSEAKAESSHANKRSLGGGVSCGLFLTVAGSQQPLQSAVVKKINNANHFSKSNTSWGHANDIKKKSGGGRDGMEVDRQSARRAVVLKDLGHVTEKRAAVAPRR